MNSTCVFDQTSTNGNLHVELVYSTHVYVIHICTCMCTHTCVHMSGEQKTRNLSILFKLLHKSHTFSASNNSPDHHSFIQN